MWPNIATSSWGLNLVTKKSINSFPLLWLEHKY